MSESRINSHTAALLRLRAQVLQARRTRKKEIEVTTTDLAIVIDDLQAFYAAMEADQFTDQFKDRVGSGPVPEIDPNDPDSIMGAFGAMMGRAVAKNLTEGARATLSRFGSKAFKVKLPEDR